jgi:imidazolonepropionase-like amidohydrolase
MYRTSSLLLVGLCVQLAAAVEPTSSDTDSAQSQFAIRAGKVITSAGDPIVNGVILVADGKITAIGPASEIEIPDGYTVLDHSDKFAMPDRKSVV